MPLACDGAKICQNGVIIQPFRFAAHYSLQIALVERWRTLPAKLGTLQKWEAINGHIWACYFYSKQRCFLFQCILSLLLVSAAVSLCLEKVATENNSHQLALGSAIFCPISPRGFRPMQPKSASLTSLTGRFSGDRAETSETESHFLEALRPLRSVEPMEQSENQQRSCCKVFYCSSIHNIHRDHKGFRHITGHHSTAWAFKKSPLVLTADWSGGSCLC